MLHDVATWIIKTEVWTAASTVEYKRLCDGCLVAIQAAFERGLTPSQHALSHGDAVIVSLASLSMASAWTAELRNGLMGRISTNKRDEALTVAKTVCGIFFYTLCYR